MSNSNNDNGVAVSKLSRVYMHADEVVEAIVAWDRTPIEQATAFADDLFRGGTAAASQAIIVRRMFEVWRLYRNLIDATFGANDCPDCGRALPPDGRCCSTDACDESTNPSNGWRSPDDDPPYMGHDGIGENGGAA